MSNNASDIARAIVIGVIIIVIGIAVISISPTLPPEYGSGVFWMGIVIILGGIVIIAITVKNAI